jgi:hypothetical protein
MPKQSRAERRPCWISSPGSKTLRQCSLFAVSDKRATIISPSPLPDTFDFYLSLDSKVGRRCMVISRSENEVGVEFLGG